MASMISRLVTAAAVMAQTQVSAPAIAQVPSPAGASSSWSIDYGERYCALVRQSADPAAPVLTLRMTPGRSSAELLVMGRKWDTGLVRRILEGEIVLLPGGTRVKAELIPMGTQKDTLNGVAVTSVPPNLLDEIAANDTFSLRYRDKPVAEFATPSARKAIKALHDCTDRLLAAWGVDVQAEKTFRASAMAIRPDWFTPDLYPKSALSSGISGSVTAVLTVRTDGRVGDCKVVGPSGDRTLDDVTCATFLTNGRFSPAIDAAGKPAESKLVMMINWRVPRFGN